MRLTNTKEDISYSKTLSFFNDRASHSSYQNPYSVTMYQDKHPELVAKRDHLEADVLLRYIDFNKRSIVLDVACGIGRWADHIQTDINAYYGVDFSEGLIKIANERNIKENFHFYVSSVKQISDVSREYCFPKFNIVLMIGIIMYINDEDLSDILLQIERCCSDKCRIIIREPVGLNQRLTLKDFYSEELNADYNAIYRTRDELVSVFETTMFQKGFKIVHEDFLFKDDVSANNRKETSQYYFVLER